ncbi:unnamed protein product [Clonostachys rhizophaga]|uniref:20S-pre-rRNA D-site endonuclease NOB1 n=1 Tax=Clonostachys rhizophaga TaxID=160324 RepID=A0A9N9YYI1_9HYPO|nr:unnamed protein product [Clonostachys rhizophaga]
MAAPADTINAPLEVQQSSPATPSESPAPAEPSTTKPIHSLVLDTGPLIKNDPPADVLRARAEQLYILPSVLPEIRDAATRTRVETTLMPFVTVRAPRPASIKIITDFARRTGDLEVLSRPDIQVLALAYELECERNGGDWRLRSTPGQKTLNGKPPSKEGEVKEGETPAQPAEGQETQEQPSAESQTNQAPETLLEQTVEQLSIEESGEKKSDDTPAADATTKTEEIQPADDDKVEEVVVVEDDGEDSDDLKDENDDEEDDGGWITPSNVKKHKAKDTNTSTSSGAAPKTLQAAVLTSDFAMQNVALRMNLNLVSPALTRISHLRTWVLRCHGCFQITRAMDRRFCPSCGQPTLLRAACTVDDRTGALTVHLKRNFQWNNRGNVYSVPKPVHGSANGRAPKTKGTHGGKNGWGRDLILSEDQKEYTRAHDEQRRQRKKDIMDDDFLPGLISGDRAGAGGKIRVGAGRNINGRKKR